MNKLNIERNLKQDIEKECSLCGAKDGWTVYKSDGLISDHKVWCKKCGLIYKKFVWSEDDNDKFYNKYYLNDYFDWALDGTNGRESHYNYAKIREPQVDKIKKYLISAKKPLEVGCSSGGVLRFLTNVNQKTIGIDIDDESIKYAREKGLNAYKMDLFITDKKFDFIWTSHVLEHLLNPQPFIKQFQRVAEPNAILVAIVPDSLKMPEDPHTPHTFNFSKKTFIQLIESTTGFRAIKTFDEQIDVFVVFQLLSKNPKKIEFSTTRSEYLEHMENLGPKLISSIRDPYDKTTSKQELLLLEKNYKELKTLIKIKFFKILFWSKLYRFFTLKWLKTK